MIIRNGNKKISANPNLVFKDSKILSDIRDEMKESFRGMKNFQVI